MGMLEDLPVEVTLQGLLQNSRDPFYLLNARRRLIFMNRACEELLGIPARQMLGKVCGSGESVESADLALALSNLCPPDEVFHGRPATVLVLLVRPNGERVWRTTRFLPCRAADGTASVVLGHLGMPDQDPEPLEEDTSLRERFTHLRRRLLERYGVDQVIAVSLPMQRVLSQVRLASQTALPVLLRGEKGVGKESLARTIHYHSANRSRPFVALDCETLPPSILQPHLATQGFIAHALGNEELAREVGVIYLREPACLPRDFQAQLGGYLDSYEKTGGPRVMAGTSVDLEQASKSGAFLERLPYQLAPLVIEVPPLRQRRPDLPYLVHQILEQGRREGGHEAGELHPTAWEFVEAYSWPGNQAELRAIVGQAQRHAKGAQIQLADFPARLRTAVELARMPEAAREPRLPLDQLLMETERRLIQLALRQAKGNISRAAARLEVSRPRLYRRMQQLGLIDAGADGPGENEGVPADPTQPRHNCGEEGR